MTKNVKYLSETDFQIGGTHFHEDVALQQIADSNQEDLHLEAIQLHEIVVGTAL